jgi:uncharacterized protein (UPF0261 family)
MEDVDVTFFGEMMPGIRCAIKVSADQNWVIQTMAKALIEEVITQPNVDGILVTAEDVPPPDGEQFGAGYSHKLNLKF